MKLTRILLILLGALIALGLACSNGAPSPTGPTVATVGPSPGPSDAVSATPSEGPSSVSGPPERCEGLAASAVSLTRGPFDMACASAGDCTIVEYGNSCRGGCEGVLSHGGAKDLRAANAVANAGPCKDFDKTCPRVMPTCLAPPAAALCQAGLCVPMRASPSARR